MKLFFYLLFALFYWLYRLLPVAPKAVFIHTHDQGMGGNIGAVYHAFHLQNMVSSYHRISREDYRTPCRILMFFLVKSYHLATARFVFLDNVFLPLAFIRFRQGVKVIQLWHGSGSVKKFGQHVNTGLLRWLERRANQAYTHLIVNSRKMVPMYSGAFGVSEKITYPIGLPRTDALWNRQMVKRNSHDFRKQFSEIGTRKIILYAPTFRDGSTEQEIKLNLDLMMNELQEAYVLLIRLHPHIAKAARKIHFSNKFIIDVSFYQDLNTLLASADILITDYSSIIYEFAIMQKPMIFYPYDINEFRRGFYYEYESYVPGPIVFSTQELITVIRDGRYEQKKLERFVSEHYDYQDGRATERLLDILKI